MDFVITKSEVIVLPAIRVLADISHMSHIICAQYLGDSLTVLLPIYKTFTNKQTLLPASMTPKKRRSTLVEITHDGIYCEFCRRYSKKNNSTERAKLKTGWYYTVRQWIW